MRPFPFGPALLFLLVLLAVPARAGISVSFQEDAVVFLKKDPALLDLIQKTLDIEEVGWAQNTGRSFTNPVGDRILPYGFRAKPKGQPGPYTVLVLLEQNEGGAGVQLTIVPVNKDGNDAGTPPTH